MTDELMEITNLVSRQLNLPSNNPSVGQIAARVHAVLDSNPVLAAAGPEGLSALIWSITPEDPAKMDPAKQAEAMLARANITSSDGVAWAKVLESYRLVASGKLTGDDASRAQVEAYRSVVDLAKIDPNNFVFTEFAAKAGLDYGTFDKLRTQGFSALQIMNAASFTKDMGLDLKKGAVVVATLQRDLPNGEAAMRKMRDNEHGIADARHKLEEDEKQGASPEQIAQDRRRLEERTREAQEYYQETRRRGEEHKPGTGDVVDKYHGLQQRAFGNNPSAEKATQAEREVDEQIRAAGKPGGPSGRTDYKPLRTADSASTELGRAGNEMVAITSAKAKHRDEKKSDTAQTNQRNDTKLVAAQARRDALNDDEGPPQPKTAEVPPPEPSRPIQSAKNTKGIPNPPTA
ncbi:MAG TPA: hypothetical protein VHE81_09350 [Lacipirellulaceae bacterium]|nr:hypothetical protein [Lacipirellulaceae bacterium]